MALKLRFKCSCLNIKAANQVHIYGEKNKFFFPEIKKIFQGDIWKIILEVFADTWVVILLAQ